MRHASPFLLTLLLFLLKGWFPACVRQTRTDLANGTFNTFTYETLGHPISSTDAECNTNADGNPAQSISSSLLTSHSALRTLTSADGRRLTYLVVDNSLTQRTHRTGSSSH